jgi:Domain of unknown function (DUF4365)
MQKSDAWYLEERAEQLAIVYLSRRNDVVITRQRDGSDDGIDLLVSLLKTGTSTGRVFGIEVKALRSNRQIHPASQREEVRINLSKVGVPRDIPFPLCLFVFIMETDEGYYRWVKKPAYGLSKKPQLLLNEENTFRKLSTEAVNEIVLDVQGWYDRRVKIPA